MAYYHTCPYCGANLDPGERCDCRDALEAEARRLLSQLSDSELSEIMEAVKAVPSFGPNSQARGNLQQKAPASVTSTDRGGVDQLESTDSTPTINENS